MPSWLLLLLCEMCQLCQLCQLCEVSPPTYSIKQDNNFRVIRVIHSWNSTRKRTHQPINRSSINQSTTQAIKQAIVTGVYLEPVAVIVAQTRVDAVPLKECLHLDLLLGCDLAHVGQEEGILGRELGARRNIGLELHLETTANAGGRSRGFVGATHSKYL